MLLIKIKLNVNSFLSNTLVGLEIDYTSRWVLEWKCLETPTVAFFVNMRFNSKKEHEYLSSNSLFQENLFLGIWCFKSLQICWFTTFF